MKRLNRIVLIGFRGVGKTTVGKALAPRIRWPYFSTDEAIVAQIGMPINKFVEANGWPPFRAVEQEVIADLKDKPSLIIDTGGGVIEYPGNMAILCEDSLTIWVDAALQDIFQRLEKSGDRPLLNDTDLRRDIESNYRRRADLYRQYAQFYVNTSRDNIDSIIDTILEKWQAGVS